MIMKFYRALDILFDRSIEILGRDNILAIVPNTCRFHADNSNTINDIGVPFSYYREAIIYEAKTHNFRFLDLESVVPVDVVNNEQDSTEFTFDGILYNKEGNVIVANCVISELNNVGGDKDGHE